MGRKRFDHKLHRVVHARERAAERYDLSTSAYTYERIRQIISQGEARLVDRTGFKAVYDLRVENKFVTVVYDEVSHRIVTFLPPYGGRQRIIKLNVDK